MTLVRIGVQAIMARVELQVEGNPAHPEVIPAESRLAAPAEPARRPPFSCDLHFPAVPWGCSFIPSLIAVCPVQVKTARSRSAELGFAM